MPEPSHMFAHVLCLPLSNTIIITCDYLIEANEKKNNKCTLSLLKNATYKDVKKKKIFFEFQTEDFAVLNLHIWLLSLNVHQVHQALSLAFKFLMNPRFPQVFFN